MYVRVEVTPGARREHVVEGKDGKLTLWVKEPAAGNHANRRVCQLVAERHGVRIKDVRILSGHHSRTKMLSIDEGK